MKKVMGKIYRYLHKPKIGKVFAIAPWVAGWGGLFWFLWQLIFKEVLPFSWVLLSIDLFILLILYIADFEVLLESPRTTLPITVISILLLAIMLSISTHDVLIRMTDESIPSLLQTFGTISFFCLSLVLIYEGINPIIFWRKS